MTWTQEDESDGLVYADVETWVSDWLAPHYRRSLDTGRLVWCAQWQEHPEAVARLTALWRCWESLAARETTSANAATFWVSYLDPGMTALLDEDGPFKACAREHSDRLKPLPTS